LNYSWSLERRSTCFLNFIYQFWLTFKCVLVSFPS
jgi:hypothetical protein